MAGSSRTPSRQRPKHPNEGPAQSRKPAEAIPTSPAPTAAVTGRAKALLIAAIVVGLALVVWLSLAAFAPGTLPPFLRPGAAPDASPTSVGQPTATGSTASTTSTVGSGAPGTLQGRIGFVRTTESGLRRDLYVVNADGSSQGQLTHNIVIEGTIQWSPDGTRILMQAGVDGVSNVAVLDVSPDNSAGSPLSLTSDIGKDSAFPAWSPDGSMIAFQSKRDGDLFQVYVMDENGSNKRRVSGGTGFAGLPTWSPDGTLVAYVSGEQQLAGSQRELYVVPAAGGEPRKLTSLGTSLTNPQWSPDGKTISVLQAVADRQTNVLLVDASTGEHRTLLQGGVVREQRFSPSGEEIVYYNVTPEEGSNVYVVRIADGAIRNLTGGPGDDYQASWSPDGTMLTWASKPGPGEYRIVVAKPDGTERRTVTTGPGDDYQPAWGIVSDR